DPVRQGLLGVAMLAVMVVGADLGTALVPVITAVLLFWIAGLERKYMLRVGAMAALVVALAVVSRGYRLGRFISFVDPEYKYISLVDSRGWIKKYVERSSAVRDASYQPRQSKIAVGTGGVLGVGLMQGKQKLMFLPDA